MRVLFVLQFQLYMDIKSKPLNTLFQIITLVFIIYKTRRFYCKTCKHTYYEKNPFSLKHDKISTYTIYGVLTDLKDHTVTFKNVAEKYNLSITSVQNIFDSYVDVKRRILPEVICIDEFYTSRKRLSNGPIEGANSRIKTILKSANGYTNFNRLRNRIMYSLNKDIPIKGNPKRK